MDRSRLTLSPSDELKQIRADIRLCNSLDLVRGSFERLQEIRRQHVDDFELQIAIADAQQDVIERARYLRRLAENMPEGAPSHAASPRSGQEGLSQQRSGQEAISAYRSTLGIRTTTNTAAPDAAPVSTNEATALGNQATPPTVQEADAAEIPEEVPKMDRRSFQVAVGLALLFTVGIFASFFYLIQTARRLNFGTDSQQTAPRPLAAAQPAKLASSELKQTASVVPAPVSLKPMLRLYTDLIGGTVKIDDEPDRDLSDGELNLDALEAGTHHVRVESRGGSAAFTFSQGVAGDVPEVTDIAKPVNAMVVLVSVKNGIGRLSTDAAGAHVDMDSKPVGEVSANGLQLSDLGQADHDLEVTQSQDRQKFVLTYTPAPTLTVFIKSDPSIGILTVSTGEDGVSIFINDQLYKRTTDHGSVRIPLKVGIYHVRAHRVGFQDPAESVVTVRKSAEAAVQFRMQPALQFGILQVKGAQPGTTVSVDHQIPALVGADTSAKIVNIQPGDHVIELRHDQQITKQLSRSFVAGQTITLTGADVLLDRLAADNKSVIPAAPAPNATLPPPVPQLTPMAMPSATGEQVHKGGGFIPYHTPKAAGQYYFQAHTKLGGVLKHGKLQWYAGYEDSNNYVLFSLDGKHAEVRQVRDGKPLDLGRTAFNLPSDQWVQIELTVKPDGLQARAKTGSDDWTQLTPVIAVDRDFTKASVGMFVPASEELAIANFRFSGK